MKVNIRCLTMVAVTIICGAGCRMLTQLDQLSRAGTTFAAVFLLEKPERIPDPWQFNLFYHIDPTAHGVDGLRYDKEWAALYAHMVRTVQAHHPHPDVAIQTLAKSLEHYLHSITEGQVARDKLGEYDAKVRAWICGLGQDRFKDSITKIAKAEWSDEARVLLTGYLSHAYGDGLFAIELRRLFGDTVRVGNKIGPVGNTSEASKSYCYLDRYSVDRMQNDYPSKIPANPSGPSSWSYVVRLVPEFQDISMTRLLSGDAIEMEMEQFVTADPAKAPDQDESLGRFSLELHFYVDGDLKLYWEGWIRSVDRRKVFAKIVTRHEDGTF